MENNTLSIISLILLLVSIFFTVSLAIPIATYAQTMEPIMPFVVAFGTLLAIIGLIAESFKIISVISLCLHIVLIVLRLYFLKTF